MYLGKVYNYIEGGDCLLSRKSVELITPTTGNMSVSSVVGP